MAAKSLKSYRNRKGNSTSTKVHEIMDLFEWCYRLNRGDLERMDELQRMYDNVVNESVWPTETKMPIPFLFSAVHEALPGAMDYLFPRSKWINLIPQDGTDLEKTEKIEWALQLMLMHRMRLAWNIYPALHACMKVGIGYAAIEPFVITPPSIYEAKAVRGGRVMASSKIMAPGSPKTTLRCIDVNPGEIITSKDGREFNGNKRVSHAFRITSYTEPQFRRMMSGLGDSEGIDLKGSADAIVEEAGTLGFFSNTPIEQDIARLGGFDAQSYSANRTKGLPVRIPVLKYYAENRHAWIANGTTLIYDAENKLSTMMTPLVKFSSNPDADRWFPPSAIEVSMKPALGLNLWINLMYDVAMEAARPALVYNSSLTGGKRPERGPNGDFAVQGDPRVAAAYLTPPNFDAGSFQVVEMLQRWYGAAMGRQVGEITPGMVRSGVNAFEGVLQTQRGRERLANSLIEMGSIEDVVRITMILMQSMSDPETFVMREWDQKLAKEYVRRVSVTPEDMLGSYDIQLDLSRKHRVSAADEQLRMQKFQALSQNPFVDQYENLRDLYADDYAFRRSVPSRERVAQMQEERRQAEMKAIEQGAGRTNPAGTQAEAAAETAPQIA